MTRRLAVARLEYAANSFAPRIAGRAAFEDCEWRTGPAARGAEFGGAGELSALHEFTSMRPDWQVTMLRCASAPPAGPMDDDLFTEFYDEVLAGIAGGTWDAVYLSLHGACLTTRRVRPELGLIAAIREAIGRVPLGATFDAHANIAAEAARHLTYASAHRPHPRLDRRAGAARVLDRLATTAEGRLNPVGAVVKVKALLPPLDPQGEAGPLAGIEAAARALETGRVLDVSAFTGFPYADTPDAGGAGMAYADGDLAAAKRAAAAMAAALHAHRGEFARHRPSPEQGIAQALAGPPGLVCVLDPADSPSAGGGGDTPGLFRALVAARPAVPSAFAGFADPSVVARARAAGVGAVLEIELGARLTREFGPPVAVRATVTHLAGAPFVGEGAPSPEDAAGGGPSCVLDVEGIAVIVTAASHAPDDPEFLRRHGIDLAELRLLCVKAGRAFSAAFAAHAALIVEIDAPGPACLDLSRLPYRRVPPDLRPSVTPDRPAQRA